MGREARAKRARRSGIRPAAASTVDLSSENGAAFWQLRARAADVQRAEHLAQQAMAALQQARMTLSQHLAALGSEHGFNAQGVQFQMHDETLTLTVTPEGQAST